MPAPDQDVVDGLKIAKGKNANAAMYFAFIPVGGSDGTLILSNTKIPDKDIAAKKKAVRGGKEVTGRCFGDGKTIVFQVAKEPPATMDNALKKVMRDAKLGLVHEVKVAGAAAALPGAPATDGSTEVVPPTGAQLEATKEIERIALDAIKAGRDDDPAAVEKVLRNWFDQSIEPQLTKAASADQLFEGALAEFSDWIAKMLAGFAGPTNRDNAETYPPSAAGLGPEIQRGYDLLLAAAKNVVKTENERSRTDHDTARHNKRIAKIEALALAGLLQAPAGDILSREEVEKRSLRSTPQ